MCRGMQRKQELLIPDTQDQPSDLTVEGAKVRGLKSGV